MPKPASSAKDPFSQYAKSYQELSSRIKDSSSMSEISALAKEVHEILQSHFKAIMDYYDKQYQQIINHLEENNKRFEKLTKSSIARTQALMENSIKQSQQMMQHNIAQIEKAFKSKPSEYFEQSIQDAKAALSSHGDKWSELYNQQREEVIKEMEPFQNQIKDMLKNSEELRKEAIDNYKKLEKSMSGFLKHKQAELKAKGKDKDMH
jgi:DNA anti-recombination protein RmuC